MTVGSVRGNERFETPTRVAQGARAAEPGARSVVGQTRLVPAETERVGWPQPEQKGLRAFQSRRARAWAKMAAGGVSGVCVGMGWGLGGRWYHLRR